MDTGEKINLTPSRDSKSPTDTEQALDGVNWKERYLRLLADLENTKARLSRTSTQEVQANKEALLKDFLPVADGLDLALMHVSVEEDSRNILQGLKMNRDLLQQIFRKHDVEELEALAQPFDPNLHESLGMVQYPGIPPNTVVRVEQKGYLINGKLLRPAKVIISSR
ncbi:molecular chaperone GrpE [Malonomonas rubra DSM 5091]|uniref:Protein GrpE n=1 Tax=Malonomonas rubra DSM 5091 TaxID=1122189 RepID=A0A1M6MGF1_MALRU|nr:nucleotide exchange factor GrpE [Malonomonas rubra]SHJ82528.1 molecular chaperone GrpE [Malonomonas rubra DSM 5091]